MCCVVDALIIARQCIAQQCHKRVAAIAVYTFRRKVRHFADPLNTAKPPRPTWEDYTTSGMNKMRGLSKWQLLILTVADHADCAE